MAAFEGKLVTSTEEALAAATAETVLQLVAAANHRVKVKEWGVFFDGVSVTAEPVLVEIVRQSTAGTSSALTPVKVDDSLPETLQTTARDKVTVEPTTGDVLDAVQVHPQQGWKEVDSDYIYIVGGGDRLGIRVTAPAAVNCKASMKFEE